MPSLRSSLGAAAAASLGLGLGLVLASGTVPAPASAHANALCLTSYHAALVAAAPNSSVALVNPVVAAVGPVAVVAYEYQVSGNNAGVYARLGLDGNFDVEPEKDWSDDAVLVASNYASGSLAITATNSTFVLAYVTGTALTVKYAQPSTTSVGLAAGSSPLNSNVTPLSVAAASASSIGYFVGGVDSTRAVVVYRSATGTSGWTLVTGSITATSDAGVQHLALAAADSARALLVVYRASQTSLGAAVWTPATNALTAATALGLTIDSGSNFAVAALRTASTGTFLVLAASAGVVQSSATQDSAATWQAPQNVSLTGVSLASQVTVTYSTGWVAGYEAVNYTAVLGKYVAADAPPTSATWAAAQQVNQISSNKTAAAPAVKLGQFASTNVANGFVSVVQDAGTGNVYARSCVTTLSPTAAPPNATRSPTKSLAAPLASASVSASVMGVLGALAAAVF